MTREDIVVVGPALVGLALVALFAVILHGAGSAGFRDHVSVHHGGRERRIDVPDGYRFVGIFSDESDGTFNVYVEYEKEAER